MGTNYYEQRGKHSDAALVECYLKYHSQNPAAKEMGVSRETIARAVRRAGIQLDGRGCYTAPPGSNGAIRICALCGKEFLSNDRRKIFCSKRCKDIAHRVRSGIKCNTNAEPYHKVCEVCGKPFDSFRDAAKTCSSECAKKYHGNITTPRDPRMCLVCGAIFMPKTDTQVTCGRECRLKKYNAERVAARAAVRPPVEYETRVCPICGEEFQADIRYGKRYCSKECAKQVQRNRDRKRHDKRIPRERRKDRIDLKRLFDRDGGECYICGCTCNFDDWRTAASGHPYPGETYPTIDHVLPVALGGYDAWDNVRLACWKCNCEIKRDSLIDAEDLDIDFAYSAKPKGTPPKRTAQYSLDGKLIRVWDSTAQIRRELGLNDKHIQAVCKRYKSNTGNAYGYHWEYYDEQSDRCG